MKNNVLVITGMHRSGTSLISQWLYKCGLHIGDDFYGADIGNADGHFEDIDFLSAHMQALMEMGISSDGWTYKPIGCPGKVLLGKLVARKQQRSQWGWKDPRTCLFLGTYRELLPAAKYIVILRDYQSVVSSLISRQYKRTAFKYAVKGGIPEWIWKYFKQKHRRKKLLHQYAEHYLKIWILYNQEIQRHLLLQPKGTYLVVDHTKLGQQHQQVFDHLTQEWGFDLSYFNFADVYKEKLLSEVLDISPYIKNKDLLKAAEDIQAALLLHTK